MNKLNPMIVVNTLGPSEGFANNDNIVLALQGPRGGNYYVYVTKDEATILIAKLQEATK